MIVFDTSIYIDALIPAMIKEMFTEGRSSRLVIEPVPDIPSAIKLPKFGKTAIDEFEEKRRKRVREV